MPPWLILAAVAGFAYFTMKQSDASKAAPGGFTAPPPSAPPPSAPATSAGTTDLDALRAGIETGGAVIIAAIEAAGRSRTPAPSKLT